MTKSQQPFFQSFIIATGVVVIDLLSKYEASRYGLVSLNTGISFGLLGSKTEIVSSAILVAFAVLSVLAIRHFTKYQPRAIGLFIGGALGNMIDRFLYGGVRDWLPVPVLQVKNNLADWAIFAAVLWLLYYEWSKKEPSLR